jgi:hypothetical protein
MFRHLELKSTPCVVKAGPSTGFKGENGMDRGFRGERWPADGFTLTLRREALFANLFEIKGARTSR